MLSVQVDLIMHTPSDTIPLLCDRTPAKTTYLKACVDGRKGIWADASRSIVREVCGFSPLQQRLAS